MVVGVWGSRNPTGMPLCFTPEDGGMVKVVCPLGETSLGGVVSNVHDFDPDIAATVSPRDLWVVEFLGCLGGRSPAPRRYGG